MFSRTSHGDRNPMLAQWVQTNGPHGGDIRCMAVSDTNLFAGTYGSAGVFLSTNNGASWTAVNTGLTNNIVLSLAVSGTNLFAGTEGSGVFRSTNNGTSWTAVRIGLPRINVRSLAVSGTNLFAGLRSVSFLPPTTAQVGLRSNRLDELRCQCSSRLRTNLFAGLRAAVSFLAPTAAQAGLRSVPN
ncbi:MAG: hypothetical protein IPG73_07375 [Ignavibacteria bacterium]|nr:hypothetical protein [Ignavibacteria bacterium]